VFIEQFIPNTNKRKYMDNPQIISWNFQPDIGVEDAPNKDSYFFEVSHDLTFSEPYTYIVSCFLRIYLKPSHIKAFSYKPVIYGHIRDRPNAPELPNIILECFNHEIYRDIEHLSKVEHVLRDDPLTTYVDIIRHEDYVNIFQIWLSISKNDKIPIHIKAEYQYKYYEYFKSLAQQD
jgi:hypothetical protein